MELGSAKSRTTTRGPAASHGRKAAGDESAAARRKVHATLALLGNDATTPPPEDRTDADVRAPAVLRIELVLDERTLREVGRAIATAYDVVLSLAPGRTAGEPVAAPAGQPVVQVVGEDAPPGRAADPASGGTIARGELRIDFGAHEVWRAGRRVALRPREFALLRTLILANGCAVSRERLLQEVWGYTEGVLSRTLDTHVRSLRRKLEANPAAPRHILTVRTVGYRFAP
jgi:DNA-binding response OmpR family regulator